MESGEREIQEGVAPNPYLPQALEPCCFSPPPTLPKTTILTWWDLAVSLNETADAQELRSHIHGLREKGCLRQQHPWALGLGWGVRGAREEAVFSHQGCWSLIFTGIPDNYKT